MFTRPVIVVAAFAAVASVPSVWGQPEKPAPSSSITVRVVDESGKAVPGVELGNYCVFPSPGEGSRPTVSASGEERGDDRFVTDEHGLATIPARRLLYPGQSRPMGLTAFEPASGRMAIGQVSEADAGATVELTIRSTAKVRVMQTSSSLATLGIPLDWTYLYVFKGETRPIDCPGSEGVHELLLPPGDYKLYGYGRDTYTEMPPLTIRPGQSEADVAIDLRAGRLAYLLNKPAPELAQIKGWKNGGPTTLASLRGKVVLLDFWGYWCGPCVHGMPEMMALHDKYKDRGLVIIGVHDDSADSIEEVDSKLTATREKVWGGRDLPFLVALDGGGMTKIEGADDQSGRGATTAAYGVRSFPTHVLIDRAGNVVGRFNPHASDADERIEALLRQGT